ncbi:MAG TPA: ribonuclease HII [Anaerolineales bacterium]|nr:ribonuclease HII [Anaerolineales bacterium]
MPAFDLSLLPPEPNLAFELPLWQAGLTAVAGIDEAGRGALAGPVAAAAVILPADMKIKEHLAGVRDSKQLTAKQRQAAREKILRHAIAWGVGFATSLEIDQMGILPATRLAACRALDALHLSPAHLLLDYILLPDTSIPQTALVKGDCRSLSIAAASILAKTSRDAVLCECEFTYPGYGFASHKGYGTRAHRDAIRQLGTCPVHRLSFELLGERRIPAGEDSQE